MKEDILEQIVEDWFISKPGRFIKHNLKFRPDLNNILDNKNKYHVHSDIDLLGIDINEEKGKPARVNVFNCKSWQDGVDFLMWEKTIIEGLQKRKKTDTYVKIQGSEKYLKDFLDPHWRRALIDKINEETGQPNFTYIIAVTKIKKENKNFEEIKEIKEIFYSEGSNIEIKIKTLHHMYNEIISRYLKKASKTTLEVTDFGRMIQLFAVAGILHLD